MYCPKCTIAIEPNDAKTCPYCATPLVDIHPSEEGMTHESVFKQIRDAKISDASTEGTTDFQVSAGNSSQSRELFDTAFEEIQLDDQRARTPGSKSLAITALLGALVLLSVIGTGIYYLNHTTAHETALQTPAKILTLPSSEEPAPTLKSSPQLEQESQEGSSHTAQYGSQSQQEIAAYRTPVQDAARHTSDSPAPKDVQGIPAQQAQEAGEAVQQKKIPSPGGIQSNTAPSAPPPAVVLSRPQKNNKDSSGTIAAAQSGSVTSAANVLTNSENGSYILLCGSFQSKEKALKLAAKIKSNGYKPFVEKADLGGKGVWYRIKLAGFISKNAAEKARSELNKTLKLEAIVAKSK